MRLGSHQPRPKLSQRPRNRVHRNDSGTKLVPTREAPMKRTLLFCVLSATVGALAATAWHQTGMFRRATAQEPLLRQPRSNALELPPPPPGSSRRPAGGFTPGTSSAAPASLDEFAPEE